MKHLISKRIILLEPNIFAKEKGTIRLIDNQGAHVDLDNGFKVIIGQYEEFFLIDNTNIISTNPSLN